MEKNIAGSNLDTAHPADNLVRSRLISAEGLVIDCTYLGTTGVLPTVAIFERACRLIHKVDALEFINKGNDGDAPTWVEVQNQ